MLSSDTGDFEVPFAPGAEQTDAQVFDMDGDGSDEFALANRNTAPCVVLYRRDGASWIRHIVEAVSLPLEAGGTNHDVDGDGDLDLVFAEGALGNRIYWWENPYPDYDPATPWTRHIIKDGGLNKHHDVIFGDVDGDGASEFIFWNGEKNLRISEIPPDPAGGPWGFETILSDPDKNEGLAIVDVNLDGVDDIVAAGRWFEWNASGWIVHDIDLAMKFTRTAAGQLIPGGRPEILFVIGDVSGDIDGTSFLTMYEWDGASWVPTSLLPFLTHAGHSLDIVDFNNDGLLDIFNAEMTLGGNDDAVARVFYGDGTGSFTVQAVSVGIEHHQSKVGDLDGDGDLDILGKPFTDGTPAVHAWLNTSIDPGVLPLDQWVRHRVDGDQPWLASHVLWGDFDLDGFMDIVSGGWVYKSAGIDYAQPWTRTPIGDPLYNVALVWDFDADGDPDLLGTDGVSQPPTHPGSTTLYWGRNEGDGTFTVLNNLTPGVTTDSGGAFIQGIVPFDLGADGTQDIAISWNFGEFGSSGIDLLSVPANPSVDIWPLITISPVSEGEELALDDIDGDGDYDLFQGSGWLRNEHPVWTRIESTSLIGGNAPYDDPDRVSMADVDGDGDKDAVIGLLFEAISIPTDLVWLEHPADPTQEWPLHVIGSGIGGGFSLSVGDVDNDGDPDVVLGEHVGATRLLIFENVDGGTSWIEHVVDDGTGESIDHHDGALVVDFENDGDLDIVSVGWQNQKVWLYENKALEPGSISDVQPPTAPTALSAAPYSSKQIDLSWQASTDDRGIFQYQVFRDGVEVGTTSGLRFSDAPLLADTTYEYSVIAVDHGGNESTPGGPVSATTLTPDLSPPDPPTNLDARVSANYVALTWGAAADDRGVVGYYLMRNGEEIATLPPESLEYFDGAVSADTPYEYSLVAFDADGNESDAFAAQLYIVTLPPPTGMWAGYGFEDDATVIADSSIYGNDASLGAGAVLVFDGRSGSALETDGIAGHVDLGNLDIPTEQLTLMAWINADDFDTHDARIISKSTGGNANDHVWMLSTIQGPHTRFRLKTDNGDKTTTLIGAGGTLLPGVWHHVAATYDGATMRLYQDGVEVGATPRSGAVLQAPWIQAYVGANPGTTDQVFDGRIDEVKIFGRALTPAEIAFEMSTPVVPGTEDTEPPSDPGSLTANATGASTIELVWSAASDNRGIASYSIERDAVEVAVVPGTQLSFEDTGLASNVTYSYVVIAKDSAGNMSPGAGPVSATTFELDTEPPTPPGSLSGIAVDYQTVDLSWTASSDNAAVSFYLVTRDGVDLVSLPPSTLGYLDTSATPDTTHVYFVTAVDTSGNVASAGPLAVVTPPAPPPPEPTGDLWAAYDFTSNGSTVSDLSGNGNDGVLTGAASIVPNGQFGDALEVTGGTGVVDLGDIDLASDQLTIAAWVNADDFGVVDARIISKATGTASDAHYWMLSTISGQRLRFRLKTDDGSPTTTLVGTGGALTAGTWHFVAATYDGTTMRLFIDGAEVGSTPKTGAVAQGPGVGANIGGNPGTNAKNFDGRIDELRIIARALGASELSDLALSPVDGEPPPPDTEAPTAPGFLDAVATSPTTVELSWGASSDARGVASYVVSRDGVDVATTPSSQLGFIDGDRTPGETHSYTVVAVDGAGNISTPAGPAVVTLPAPDIEPPTSPGSLTATVIDHHTVEVGWAASTDNVGIAYYLVTRDATDIATVAPTTTTLTDAGATPDTTHLYYVTAVDGSGNVATSGPVSASTPPAPPPDPNDDVWAAYDFATVDSTVVDTSGNGNDGTLVGEAVVVPNGRFGQAVELTGGVGRVDLGTMNIQGDQVTIAAWINADDFGVADGRIISKAKGTATNAHYWMLSTITGQYLRFRLKTDDGNKTTTLVGDGAALTAGAWHFIAATYDGATMRLYLDGVEVGATAKTGSIAQSSTIGVAIGANPGTDTKNFDGRIDELRIITRALNATELADLAGVPVE